MDDHRTAKLWLPEHGNVGRSPPVHQLRQTEGLVVGGVLLRSVMRPLHVVVEWENRRARSGCCPHHHVHT